MKKGRFIINTGCTCYKPNEYIDLSTVSINSFCKNCRRFIENFTAENPEDYKPGILVDISTKRKENSDDFTIVTKTLRRT